MRIIISIFLCIPLLLMACESGVSKQNEPATAQLDNSVLQNLDLVPATNQLVQETLSLTGKVGFDENRLIKIYPLVSGLVSGVQVELGDYVSQGQSLAIIHSSEIAGYQNDLSGAKAQLAVSSKNLDIAEELFAKGLTSYKEVRAASAEKALAKAEYQKISQVLQIYGNLAGKDAQYQLKAPIAGYVVDKAVSNGYQLRPDNNQALFTLADLRKVWIRADVYETDIAKIKVGDSACVHLLSNPTQVFKGKIDRLSAMIDSESKTMKARIEIPNPDLSLKPEMFVSVAVSYTTGRSMSFFLPAIPSKALVFSQDQQHVVVYLPTGKLQNRLVQLHSINEDTAYLSAGLSAGEKVVTKHPLLIYSSLK